MINESLILLGEMRNARSPIELKLYVALYRRYAPKLVGYPRTNLLRINCPISKASAYVRDNDQNWVFKQVDRDVEIDLFLCLEHFVPAQIDGW